MMRMNQAVLQFSRKQKLPMVIQDERSECGHACVAMISCFHGHSLDLYQLRQISPTSGRGVTLLDINQLLEGLGFITRALQVPLEELSHIQCPAILHWNMNHFVVLKAVKKNLVVIHDPAVGIRHCTMEEVSRSFTGIVLEVDPSIHFKAILGDKPFTLYELIKTIRGVNLYIILLLLLSLCIEVLHLLNPLFIQYVTDDVIGYSEQSNLVVIASGFLILILIQVVANYVRGNMVVYFTNNLTEQFSSNVVSHLLKLPLSFFEKRHKGDLQSKFQAIDQIQKKISTDFVNAVLDGFMIMVHFAVMWIYSSLLTILVCLALCVSLALRYFSYQGLRRQTETSIHEHAKAMSAFLETLQGIIPIKSFLKERLRFGVWRNAYIDALNADIRVSRLNVIYQVSNQLLSHVEHILVVCIGTRLVLLNQFSVGMLIAFLSYRLLFVNKASSFIQNIVDYQLITIQLRRLSDILFQEPEVVKQGCMAIPSTIKGALTLENVSFKYDQRGGDILNQVHLKINAGEKVVIIGRSGGGKSTLLKVMMGLLDRASGEIYIDDISIDDLGLKHYRDITAAVMQDDALLSGSILNNIAFFDEQIDLNRVYEVAKLAFIHDEIRQLPMGYETLVGDMGSHLSGGQKQRILLARALYKRPKILFLDEATSHLDVENEKKINQALKALSMTQIVIAHRQETILMADRVIDLKDCH